MSAERLYAFEVTDGKGSILMGLPLDPSGVNDDWSPAVEVTHTLGGVLREFSTAYNGEITVNAETGHTLRRGYDRNGNIIMGSSLDFYYELREFLEWYYNNAAKNDSAYNLELIWHNFQDDRHYKVELKQLRVIRDQNHRLALGYQFTLEPYRKAVYLPPALGFFDKLLAVAQAAIDAVMSIVNGVTAVVSTVNTYINRVDAVLQYASNITGAINALTAALDAGLSTIAAIKRFPDQFWGDLKSAINNMVAVINERLTDIGLLASPDYAEQADLVDNLADLRDWEKQADRLQAMHRALQVDNTYKMIPIMPGQSIWDIVQVELGDTTKLQEVIAINNLTQPYISTTGKAGTLKPGDFLLLPQTAVGPVSQADSLSQRDEIRLYGIGLKLDDGDLVLESGDEPEDIQLVKGNDNILQQLDIYLRTKKGTNVLWPDMGLLFGIGDKMLLDDVAVVMQEIMAQLGRDDRIESTKDFHIADIGDGYDIEFTAMLISGRQVDLTR